MSILNFAAFNQYAKETPPVLLNSAETIYPELKGVTYRWLQHNTSYNGLMQVPPDSIESHGRPWFYVRPLSNITTTARTITLTVTNSDISPELIVPGNVICFGFKFATAENLNGISKSYVGFRAPGTTSVGSLTLIAGPTIEPNEYRWIDFRFRVNNDMSMFIEIFVNKELIRSFTANQGLNWGVGVGNISGSLFTGPTGWQTQGFYVNDFITAVERVDSGNSAEMIGPVTVKELLVSSVRVSGDWKAPAGKTVQEALNNKRTKYAIDFEEGEYLRSDPHGKPMTAMFEYPSGETQDILAIQESFVLQKPPSQSSAMEYQRVYGDSPVGAKQVFSPNYTDKAVVVNSEVVFPSNGRAFTAEEITGRGVTFNSAKKTVTS